MMLEENKQESKLVQSLRDKIEELETILTLMPGHIFWMNKEGVYLGSNQKVAELLNLDSRDQIVGKHISEVLPPTDTPVIDKINREVIEKGIRILGEELCEIPGHEGVYLTEKVPLKNKKGKIIGLLGISLDITNQKRIEKELQEAKRISEIANQTKTEFIRNMEHDIRTPLCGILSVATYLNDTEPDSNKKEFLHELERSTKELLTYLDNILEFSQINTGTVPTISKEFDLKLMLSSILNMESAAAKHKSLELELLYSDSCPKQVIADRFRLHRIFINLVNNAIKFTHHGHIKIHVNVRELQDSHHANFEIIVEDTGIGIKKEHHLSIYDKFKRCDLSNKGLYQGTGLGLWIVNQFINELKGDIRLESEVGKGSRFICTIPFQLVVKEKTGV